ncbi:MAG: cell division protein FtsZ [Ktedonobacterales bacterium]|jgi:cell division protein FtsZ
MPTENPPDEARETPQSDATTPDNMDAAAENAAQPIINLNRSQTRPLSADAPPASAEHAAADEPLDIGWRDASDTAGDDTGSDSDADQPQAAPQSEREYKPASAARLIVVGVGGAGCNIVNHMIESGMGGVEFLAVNTDTQALSASRAHQRISIGERLTRGMGTGGDPAVGQQAAQESYEELVETLSGADMVFITAGMGGGTGTGASPIVAQAAREGGALTLAIVTTPFAFERRRRALAEQGVAALRAVVDALITVPNERLAQIVGRDTSLFEAYRQADEALRVGVQGVSELITIPGLINLDFADVRAVMSEAGSAYLAIGSASGGNRAEQALHSALSNPLLDVDITGARGLIFNVTGGDDLSMREVEQIANALSAAVHPDANLIFGATYDPNANDTLKVTVVATGFEPHVAPEARPSTWTPGRIALAPDGQEPRPEQRLPGRMRFDEPLPTLTESPGGDYRRGARAGQGSWQTPSQPPAGAERRADVTVNPVSPVNPASVPPGYPPANPASVPPGQRTGAPPVNLNAPGYAQPVAPSQPPATPGGADQVVRPQYPREDYAENTEGLARAPEHEARQGFWSRLFSASPPPPPEPPPPSRHP